MKRWSLFWASTALAVAMLTSGCVITGSRVREAYETCTASDTCTGITTCQRASLMSSTDTSPGFQCTASCTPGSLCQVDRNGFAAVCVVGGTGGGQCYQECPVGGCSFGFSCLPVPGSASRVCVPNGTAGTPTCGGIGQACCSGNVCTAASSVCTTAGVCAAIVAGPQPYEGCAVGATCGGGGPMSCQRPMIANPSGTNGWCTRQCTAAASECPALPGQITDCYVLRAATSGQCYVACPSGSGCPVGTTCSMTDTMTATGVRLCIPL